MRRLSNLPWEGYKAAVSLAGFRTIVQAKIDVGAGADVTYTVTAANTNRVCAIHVAPGDLDIRYEYNAAADGTKIPILPKRYFIIDAEKPDVLHFFNTSSTLVTIYLAELE